MRRTIIALAAIATLSSAQAAIQTVEADNGAVYRIQSIRIPYDRSAPILAEVYDDNEQLIYLSFDCDGHFVPSGGHWQHIPPRSVVGRIGQIACSGRR